MKAKTMWRVTYYKEGEGPRVEYFTDEERACRAAEEWENPHAHNHVPAWSTVGQVNQPECPYEDELIRLRADLEALRAEMGEWQQQHLAWHRWR